MTMTTNTQDLVALFESDDTMQLLIAAVVKHGRELVEEAGVGELGNLHSAVQEITKQAMRGDVSEVIIDAAASAVLVKFPGARS